MDPATAVAMDPRKLVKLDEPFYTAEQIVVPPELPEILKQFTKAAIKTQPPDLLEWACNYFRARASGDRLPVKERLEVIPDDYDDLTLGLLKILHHEMGHKRIVSLAEVQDHWVGLGLSPDKLNQIIEVGKLPATIEWHRFVIVACGKLAEKMEDIFTNFCLVLTKEPEGNNALVPFELFRDAYEFVASSIEPVQENVRERFLAYMSEVAKKQNDMVHPGDITYRDCPPMHRLQETSRPEAPE